MDGRGTELTCWNHSHFYIDNGIHLWLACSLPSLEWLYHQDLHGRLTSCNPKKHLEAIDFVTPDLLVSSILHLGRLHFHCLLSRSYLVPHGCSSSRSDYNQPLTGHSAIFVTRGFACGYMFADIQCMSGLQMVCLPAPSCVCRINGSTQFVPNSQPFRLTSMNGNQKCVVNFKVFNFILVHYALL